MRIARFIGLRLIASTSARRPTMKPACGPPSSLSPEKVTRSAPSATASATVGSRGRPKGGEVDEGAGAEVVDERHAVRPGDRGELGGGHLLDEADDAVVRGVDLEDQPGVGGKRGAVVAGVGAVGGADLDDARPGPRHDVGHPEGAADLDQLAARDDRLAALRQRVQGEEHGGGVVVDDGGVLGAGQLDEEVAQDRVALAALAAVEVELERERVAHRGHRGLDRLLGEEGAAEVGVEHGAGEVEDRAHLRARGRVEARDDVGGDGFERRGAPAAVAEIGAGGGKARARRGDHARPAVARDRRGDRAACAGRRRPREGGAGRGSRPPGQYPARNGLTPPRRKSSSRTRMSRPSVAMSSATGSRAGFFCWYSTLT